MRSTEHVLFDVEEKLLGIAIAIAKFKPTELYYYIKPKMVSNLFTNLTNKSYYAFFHTFPYSADISNRYMLVMAKQLLFIIYEVKMHAIFAYAIQLT